MKTLRILLSAAAILCSLSATAQDEAEKIHLRFDLGTTRTADGYTAVPARTIYSSERGYGFEPGVEIRAIDRGGDALRGDFVTASPLFQFSAAVPEGNYRVTVTLGDPQGTSLTTVKSETGRLVLERLATLVGEQQVYSFLVNTRTRTLSPGNAIKLDVREWNPATDRPVTFTWDDKLTLQFSDENPCVAAVEIESADQAVTIFLTGDSTVTDQATEPYGTWGQQLGRWFDPPVVVANHAESGQTLKAFRFQRRWDKVMERMNPGDYVFLQFGHNDLNQRGHDAMWPLDDAAGDWVNTHSDALTDYAWTLASCAVEVARRGGIPVIVSPMTKMNRQTGLVNAAGMGDYPQGAREAARLAGCAFIDLNAMSIAVVEGLGPEQSPAAYVDGLHTNTYGGYLLSRCIVEGIRRAGLGIAQHIRPDAGTFDPARPRPLPADFTIPLDPQVPVPMPPGYPPRSNR
jgi:lysophospholipase L1-like esterase